MGMRDKLERCVADLCVGGVDALVGTRSCMIVLSVTWVVGVLGMGVNG